MFFFFFFFFQAEDGIRDWSVTGVQTCASSDLGVKDNTLFVCDGSSGLKVYDKSNIPALEPLNHFKDIVTFDVIPLEDHLLMVGDEILYQYAYLGDGIREISRFSLN